jgi:hypothetical protein
LRRDLLRAGAGLVLTLAPLSVRHDSVISGTILGSIAGLFLLFALRTGLRFLTLVEVTGEGISWAPVGSWTRSAPGFRPVRIAWRNVDRVSLRFFSTKRDRSEGWMVLGLGAGAQRVRFESTLEGFRTIAARCARAATENNVWLSSSTIQNFRSLGVPIADEVH